jgi:hypothetical protein
MAFSPKTFSADILEIAAAFQPREENLNELCSPCPNFILSSFQIFQFNSHTHPQELFNPCSCLSASANMQAAGRSENKAVVSH